MVRRRFAIVSMYILYGYNNGLEWNQNRIVPPSIPPTLERPDHPPPIWPSAQMFLLAAPIFTRPLSLYLLLLTLNESEKPVGGSARVMVGKVESLHRSGEKEMGSKIFMILKEK